MVLGSLVALISVGLFWFVGCVDFRWVVLRGCLALFLCVGIRCSSWFAGRVDFRLVVFGSFAALIFVGLFLARWLRCLLLGSSCRLFGTFAFLVIVIVTVVVIIIIIIMIVIIIIGIVIVIIVVVVVIVAIAVI